LTGDFANLTNECRENPSKGKQGFLEIPNGHFILDLPKKHQHGSREIESESITYLSLRAHSKSGSIICLASIFEVRQFRHSTPDLRFLVLPPSEMTQVIVSDTELNLLADPLFLEIHLLPSFPIL